MFISLLTDHCLIFETGNFWKSVDRSDTEAGKSFRNEMKEKWTKFRNDFLGGRTWREVRSAALNENVNQ